MQVPGRPCHVCPKYRVVAICADGYRIGNYHESVPQCGAGAKAENPCPAEVKQEIPLPRVEWLHWLSRHAMNGVT
jgi:hypothetical protein